MEIRYSGCSDYLLSVSLNAPSGPIVSRLRSSYQATVQPPGLYRVGGYFRGFRKCVRGSRALARRSLLSLFQLSSAVTKASPLSHEMCSADEIKRMVQILNKSALPEQATVEGNVCFELLMFNCRTL